MTTDHMELRTAAAQRISMKNIDGDMVTAYLTFVNVSQIALEELLAAYDALAHPAAPKGKYSAEFEEAWSEYPKRPGASKAATWKAWQARIKAKISPESMIEGARRYAAYCKAERTEPQYIKQPATFFGPGEHYDADWMVERGGFRLSPSSKVPMHEQLADQRAAASAAAKARLLGHRPPPPDDGMTFDMEPRP